MRNLHEKMCSAVFTDMIAHLKIVNEMLNVEVFIDSTISLFQKSILARKNRRWNRGGSSTASSGMFEHRNKLTRS